VTEAEADDVCQEVFVVVHRRILEFEGRSSMRTWLFSILKRVVHSHRRSFARRDAKHTSPESVDLDALTYPGRQPEESYSLRQQVDVARELLSEVDEEKRPLLILVDIEDMNVSEAAETLDLNANTASSRLRAGRQQVSAALTRYRARADFNRTAAPHVQRPPSEP
jgi:RNA polymerase sigma-70 factor (ECF subfamily)